MAITDQMREEEQFRQAERAMLFADDAARRISSIAAQLEREDGPDYMVEALEKASAAIRSEHKRMMKSIYWRPPEARQQPLPSVAESD
ncbi:MAG: hypothetical protein ACR2OC_11940 [Solirubrobacterales bacterium]